MTQSVVRTLFVTPECTPLVKTGGLGDVSASLTRELHRMNVDVRLLMPRYSGVDAMEAVYLASFPASHGFPDARLLELRRKHDAPVYLVDCPAFYDRNGGPYQDASRRDWTDNALRFGLLCRVAALIGAGLAPLSWRPDVIHCNDWQSGLVPTYLRYLPRARVASLVTIHNLAFQGIFDRGLLHPLGLPDESYSIEGVEYFGQISFLKAGLVYSDAITTVSPAYAREIQAEPLGFGLQGVLHARRDVLTGILNGIDTEQWNPAADAFIPAHYSARTLARKEKNKRALTERCGLASTSDRFLLGMVTRLTEQKGIDVCLEAMPELLELPLQMVILGTGEAKFERALLELAKANPARISVTVGFDEQFAHLIEAGADALLMPSRFEPCGMNQMYSQRYATPPIAHATGGLADSIIDCEPQSLKQGNATGFLFHELTAPAMLEAIGRALERYRERRAWRRIQRAGMAADFSWSTGALRYLEVYRSAIARAAAR